MEGKGQESLEYRIQMNMKKAFKDLIVDTFSKHSLSQKEIEWAVSLCKELKEKINKLTPSRTDLHTELDSSFDVTLVEQMLTHNAFEMQDLTPIISILKTRIMSLCAPVQDEHVAKTFDKISKSANMGECIGLIVFDLNEIIDVTHNLHKNFMELERTRK